MNNRNNLYFGSSKIVLADNNLLELYRGFPEIPKMMFSIPITILGVFGRKFPQPITFEDIKQHKLTNMPNRYHMVSMSNDKNIARNFGRNNFITIDSNLFRDFIINVHQTYSRNLYNFPSRMAIESEFLTLAILYCTVKSIALGDKTILNPFYLPISTYLLNEQFKQIYLDYINILSRKYNHALNSNEEIQVEQQFIARYLHLYDDFYITSHKDNPFYMPLAELKKKYPDYMEQFLRENAHILKIQPSFTLFQNITLKQVICSLKFFAFHPYTKNMDQIVANTACNEITCYDDFYARPIYD